MAHDPLPSLEERLSLAVSAGVTTQESFERVLAEIALTRITKVEEYGEERYSDRWNDDEQLWMIFSDIYRKFIRLRQQVRSRDKAGLRETCLDLSSYGAMGVQLLDMMEER